MSLPDIGIVVIARNEGERLRRCLESCVGTAAAVIYADSASTDGSVELAREAGAEVVVLDVSERPPNQPRGRNAGFARLREILPNVRYVFFVDGDCELVPGFLAAARDELERDECLGAVCGRRLELHPEASVYNMLVDTEWNTPVGEADGFGGDALVRVAALDEVGGYEESMVSGEDHELSFRLREKGWGILRVERDMTRHDVALHRFGPWWKRHVRGGYAYTHGAALNFHGPHWFNVKRCASMLAWGFLLPLLAVGLAPFTGGWSLAALGAYGLLWWRVRAWRVGLGDDPGRASVYAAYITLGKVAEAWGVLKCVFGLVTKRGFRYRTYKDYQRAAPQ